jgi:hypothetical protein
MAKVIRSISMVFAIEFVTWAQSLHGFPTTKQICDRWGIGRASAYRYRQSYADAMKIPMPRNPAHGLVPNDYRANPA